MAKESTPGKSLKLFFFYRFKLSYSVIVVYTPSRGHLNSFTMSCLPRACLSTSFRCRILGFHPIICDVVSGNATFSSLVTLFAVLPFSSLSLVGSLSMFFSCCNSSPSWPILSVCCCNYKLQGHWVFNIRTWFIRTEKLQVFEEVWELYEVWTTCAYLTYMIRAFTPS